ncbi:LytR/AlgR family response regulator transcription factor [Microscilla marina]|uniref:Two-component system response regulator protein n=1 Tax=Microscilla marina ATCC 23134 TaxID=313606 RepID=A1ZFR4_MICM2|nr:response regulator transcription factor [Microscilla marina]EAY30838.1 two-component system response regulator protein [Microscilla marina ATCC 23134]
MKLKCLLVDDEPLAHKIIQNYIARLNTLEVVGSCYNAIEALNFLYEHEVDLMFLDIQMPELNGLDMLKTLPHSPKVILTTAYTEFALESYEFGVVDYLLKPIAFPRFLKAVNRVIDDSSELQRSEKPPVINQQYSNANESLNGYLFLKENQVTHKVFLNNILFIQAYGNYLKFFTEDKMIMVADTMKNIMAQLPESDFVRVHKSYIVSLSKIDQIEGNQIKIINHTLPVGNKYRLVFEQKFKR